MNDKSQNRTRNESAGRECPALSPIAPALLSWFAGAKRSLPFRLDPSPYHIWVSEIMLQQTRVTAALPYYERFIRELPDIPALAACGEEKLHKLWEGLGYYSRVRNLQKAARILCETNGGQLPADLEALKKLPGIGDYTAGAIASIGFGLPAPAVDGNVLRVFSRLYNRAEDITLPETKRLFTALVMAQQPPETPGPFNEALMELGALICLPNGAPLCESCPLNRLCRAYAAGTAETLPVKAPPKPRRVEQITVALVQSEGGRWLLQQRPQKGLLAGLWQPCLWPGEYTRPEIQQKLADLGIAARWVREGEPATHIFTHIEWQMAHSLWRAAGEPPLPEGYVWVDNPAMEQDFTLPGAFKNAKKQMSLL